MTEYRKLDAKETKISKASLKRNEEELELLRHNLQYNNDVIALNEQQRDLKEKQAEFEAKHRDYNRKIKNMENDVTLKRLKNQISETEEIIETFIAEVIVK